MACVATNGMSLGRSIPVGGSQGWCAGTNYTDWAIQSSPFHTNDTLGLYSPLSTNPSHQTRVQVFSARRKCCCSERVLNAIQNSPFHTKDILVFKYSLPDGSAAAPSVYLMPDQWTFVTCDFKVAKLMGTPTEVSRPEGLEVQLDRREPYYFASDVGNGYGCLEGRAKFVATPVN